MLNQFAHNASAEDVLTTEEGVVEHMTDGNHWLGDGGFAVFWMVALMAVIILIIFLVLKNFSDNSTNIDSLEIAKQRYAKGEITKKEYDSLKKELSK